jgi:hypothetical protein
MENRDPTFNLLSSAVFGLEKIEADGSGEGEELG